MSSIKLSGHIAYAASYNNRVGGGGWEGLLTACLRGVGGGWSFDKASKSQLIIFFSNRVAVRDLKVSVPPKFMVLRRASPYHLLAAIGYTVIDARWSAFPFVLFRGGVLERST